MSAFSSDGVVTEGPNVKVTVVDYPSTEKRDGEGWVVYSDECVISPISVCTRVDDLHAAAPDAPGPRWWACPLHDNR